MTATFGTASIALNGDTSAAGLYSLWKNTICPGMGFSNSTELLQDVTNTRLVYTKTNLVGTYSTTYWRFAFAANSVIMNLYHAYNTSTDVGTGLISGVNNTGFTFSPTTLSYTIYYWKDSAVNPQWGMVNVRSSDANSTGSLTYNGGFGWCKVTPFSIMDPNTQPTTLFIGGSSAGSAARQNFLNSTAVSFFGGSHTVGTTQTQGKSLQTAFALGHYGGASSLNISSGFFQAGTLAASTAPIMTTPVIVGTHGLALGYVNSLDLGATTPLEYDKYRLEDRLIVTAGVEEWQPTGRYSHSLFIRVV